MNEEQWRAWAAIDDSDVPGNFWGVRADQVVRVAKLTYAEAADAVILYWLRRGEIRPLAALFQCGAAPSPDILRYVSAMLSSDVDIGVEVPYGLKPNQRVPCGRPTDGAVEVRNDLVALNVEKMKVRDGYESAVASVVEILREHDPKSPLAIGRKSVEPIHGSRYPKKARG